MLSSNAEPRGGAPARWSLDEFSPEGHVVVSSERNAQAEIERALAEAYARGQADGRAQSEGAQQQEIQFAVEALAGALVTLQREAEVWLNNASENVCALAIAVARQVMAREVVSDPTFVSALAVQALQECPLEQPIVVRMHPDDLAAASNAIRSDALSSAGVRADIQWQADPRVSRGGCLLEGRDRIVDGRVDAALERLYRRLTLTDA